MKILFSIGIKTLFDTSYGLSVTGIAGPSGGTKKKPIGLVYIGLATDEESIVQKFRFKGNRNKVRSNAASKALRFLFNVLLMR